jgi:hypothetical protein
MVVVSIGMVTYSASPSLRLIEVESISALSFVLMDDIRSLGDVENCENNKSIVLFRVRAMWTELFLEL